MVSPPIETKPLVEVFELLNLPNTVKVEEYEGDLYNPQDIGEDEILLFRQQIQYLAFPLHPLILEFLSVLNVSPLQMNPSLLLGLQALGALNMLLTDGHIFTLYDFLSLYVVKSSVKGFYIIQNTEGRRFIPPFHKAFVPELEFREWGLAPPLKVTGAWRRPEHQSYRISHRFSKDIRKYSYLLLRFDLVFELRFELLLFLFCIFTADGVIRPVSNSLRVEYYEKYVWPFEKDFPDPKCLCGNALQDMIVQMDIVRHFDSDVKVEKEYMVEFPKLLRHQLKGWVDNGPGINWGMVQSYSREGTIPPGLMDLSPDEYCRVIPAIQPVPWGRFSHEATDHHRSMRGKVKVSPSSKVVSKPGKSRERSSKDSSEKEGTSISKVTLEPKKKKTNAPERKREVVKVPQASPEVETEGTLGRCIFICPTYGKEFF